MSKISILITEALKEDTSIDAHVSLSNLFNSIAQRINSETGVDCKGAEVVITAYDIAHIFKRHGDDKEEKKRGQIGVVGGDFEFIRDIIFSYDIVKKGKDGRGTKSLLFIKRIKVEYTVMASIEGKVPNKKMVVKTLFKKP